MVLHPLDVGGAHAPLLIILAAGGLLIFLYELARRQREKRLSLLTIKHLVFAASLFGLETIIAFSYTWGRSLHPASARLFIWLDTCVALLAAWFLTTLGRRFASHVALLKRPSGAPFTILVSLTLFAMHVPGASEARFINSLILTRQAAQTWDFFAKLGDKNILIMTDRPGLFTIMDYGALDISTAAVSRDPLLELSRHLYHDIYLIQEVDLNTHKPLPSFDVWTDVPMETVLNFRTRTLRRSELRASSSERHHALKIKKHDVTQRRRAVFAVDGGRNTSASAGARAAAREQRCDSGVTGIGARICQRSKIRDR